MRWNVPKKPLNNFNFHQPFFSALWKLMTASATLVTLLFVETEDKINFVSSAPPYWLSINYHSHPLRPDILASLHCKVLSYLSSAAEQFSFCLPSSLSSHYVLSWLHFYNLPGLNFMEPALCITLSYSWLFLHFLVYTNWLCFYFQYIYY